ncbi:MAG TPA: gliding motility-associated C-terminal domain-containing protein [Flavobacteriales bacterium]|nr:gliding motility-associated C-terminal domain-containing protein [Flavobacteriales bacterium]
MDKFDKILRDKLANHDAGMGNGAWEQFAQNFDKVQGFENALRTKLHNHDAGISNGAWEQFEQRLNQPSASNWVNYLTAGIAAVLVGVGVYYFSGETTTKNTTKPVATETTLAHNKVKGNPVTTPENATNTTAHVETNNNNNVVSNNTNVESNNNGNKVVVNNNVVNNNAVNNTNNNALTNAVNNTNNVVNNTVNNNKVNDTNNNTTANNNATNANNAVNGSSNGLSMVAPEYTGYVSEVCQNETMVFKATNVKPGYTVTWLLNGEEVSGDASLKLILSKEGAQTIQLVYSANDNGKQINAASEKSIINVLPAPHASFDVIPAESETYPEYTFTRTEGKDLTAMWNFDGKDFSTDEIGKHVYPKKGVYNTTLTVTGKNGCQAKISNKVEVAKDYNLLAPNSFSPNNDGINETFLPVALTVMSDVQFKMTIYDRTGKRIYETSRADAPWDGVDATTGAKCSTNTYMWRVQLSRGNNVKPEVYNGTILLLDK